MDEIKNKLIGLKEKFDKISNSIDLEELHSEIASLEQQTMQPDFWTEQQKAAKVSQELADKQRLLETLETLNKRVNGDLEMTSETSMEDELEKEAREVEKELDSLELRLYLSGPYDKNEAILSVHAGTGGTEAMDWAAMLARMYQRYFEKMGWKYEITDESFGEEVGYKSISMIVHAPLTFGSLKKEAGTHRLVRQSPFNADALRQTSFALVEILPVIEDDREVEIKDEDIEFESFRSGGHGGQNVNKVSTAVRLKHIPTDLIVTAQTERSQLQNRENALKLLKAKLWLLKQEEQEKEKEKIKGGFQKATWGTQIRSYVLHPYHMVKDLRTNVETSDTDSVLDGNLDQFIEAELTMG